MVLSRNQSSASGAVKSSRLRSCLAWFFVWSAILWIVGVSSSHAVTVITGAQADATVPIGVCGSLGFTQGNAITLQGNEFGGGGIPIALSSDGGTWFTFLAAGAPSQDRIAVNGQTGNTPTRDTSVTKYTGSATDPAPPLSLGLDPSNGRVHLLQTYQTAGCGGSPPCQADQVVTGAFTDLGSIAFFTGLNNSGAGSFTASDVNNIYETYNTSTGGAGVVLRRINGGNGVTADSFKTSAYTSASLIAINTTDLFQAPATPNTTLFRYTKIPLATAGSINLGFAISTNALAASDLAVWLERDTFASLCQVNLPAFSGCSSTYNWTPATEGTRTYWMGYDNVNARLYVLRSDTATDTVPAFLHRFTVTPLAKEATFGLTFTSDHTPQPNSVGFSIPKQRITWIGSRGMNGFNATVNTVSVCGNITG